MIIIFFISIVKLLPSSFINSLNNRKNLKFTLNAEISNLSLNDYKYLKLDIVHELNNLYRIFNINLKLTFLYSLERGIIKYRPYNFKKLFDTITVRWIEINTEYLKLRYGKFKNLTYGYDLIMDNYSSHALIGNIEYINNHTFKFMFPVCLKSKKPDLYAFRYELEFFYKYPYLMGLNYFRENSDKKNPLNIFTIDGFIDISDYFVPYIEIAKMLKFGIAASLGFRSSLNVFNYDLGYKFLNKNFKARIYDEFYSYRNIESFNFYNKRGVYLKIGLDIEDRFESYVKYEYFGEYDKDIVFKICTNVLRIDIDFKYKQEGILFKKLEVFNKANSSFIIHLKIPLFSVIKFSLAFKRPLEEPINFKFKTLINIIR